MTEQRRFDEFSTQMFVEKNINQGFYILEPYSYDDTLFLEDKYIPQIIQLLDEKNEYDLLGFMAIWLNEHKQKSINIKDFQKLCEDVGILHSISDWLDKLKICPFLKVDEIGNLEFSYSGFEAYYLGREIMKCENSYYKHPLKNSFYSFYIDFKVLFSKIPSVYKLLQDFENQSERITFNGTYTQAAKLRDFKLYFFHKFIQPEWPYFSNKNWEDAARELILFIKAL